MALLRRRPELWILVAPILALAIITVPLFLAGGPGADAEQARLCRMLLPALYPQDEGITVLDTESSPGNAVHVTFRTGDEANRPHLLTCRFGGIGYSAARRDLSAVLIDGVGLGESTLYILRNRWLETQFAVEADPGPPRHPGEAIELTRPLALALQHLIGGLPRLGILALLALSTALIYGLIGRINLALGEFLAFGGIMTTLAALALSGLGPGGFTLAGSPLVPVLAGALAVTLCGLAGLVLGRGLLWPLTRPGAAAGVGQPVLVAGIGLVVAMQEALRLSQGAGTMWLPPAHAEGMVVAVSGSFDVILHPRLLVMALVNASAILAVLWLMKRTAFGRAWRASADDPEAARLCGVDPEALLARTAMLAIALAGLAGATIALNYGGIHFSGGTMMGLTGLIAAILGGIGSIGGAVLGGLVIGLFQIGWSALMDIALWELASFVLLTLALILKPGGFFGFAEGPMRKV
ncbi:branched-chain amino acid ABC transporter permease [Rhabdaerophilum sp. SD176]|uniref:branched-chain amino acid ABC transporter permease n=1 Tax=Rhabdaerophilum sp. SD176 TaxID=2983548 RepID=UPI0024E000D6|nr:branched-chain amino acid ABC transporter permease [Rhabdaerophilum sp. SD176]